MNTEHNYTEDGYERLTDWLADVAAGLACNALDGFDLLPLYAGLPPMDPVVEQVVDQLLARSLDAWSPPLASALRRRQQAAGLAARGSRELTADEAERVARWSSYRAQAELERWLALVNLVWVSGGDGERLLVEASERQKDGPTWSGLHQEITALPQRSERGRSTLLVEDADAAFWRMLSELDD